MLFLTDDVAATTNTKIPKRLILKEASASLLCLNWTTSKLLIQTNQRSFL